MKVGGVQHPLQCILCALSALHEEKAKKKKIKSNKFKQERFDMKSKNKAG